MMDELTHVDSDGSARMVNVSAKRATLRTARASGRIRMSREAFGMVRDGKIAKGAVLSVARVAAVGAAKRTSDIVPLCHPLQIDHAEADFSFDEDECAIECTVSIAVEAKTGPELEAVLGVMGGLVTIYDMCKAVDKSMEIGRVRLLFKSGGKSGDWLPE